VPLATSLFDYDLPPRLIAQTPAARRDESRLLVVDRATRTLSHRQFRDLPEYLHAGDVLFRNNAAVLPARLQARRPTGGAVECFLLRPESDPTTWTCLVKPGKKLPMGEIILGPDHAFTGEIVARHADGSASVKFTTPGNEGITSIANRLGLVPLPPYIERADASTRATDLERYQTVYAEKARQVAVAAPTAGLHFTPELLATLAATGVGTADVTLHVGLGTFRPITAETVEGHAIHREIYEISAETRSILERMRRTEGGGRKTDAIIAADSPSQPYLDPSRPARRASPTPLSGRRIAVGTTTVRTIEHYLAQARGAAPEGLVAEADIFIYPPYEFRGIDALVTNFHQPRSTLLCLVSAFLAPGSTDGIAWLKEIYAEAITREYRFFSYGDAMLIL
jgi:S-adenosylmethionine:tRNA ribosyltransferase-isomerase